MEIGDRAGSLLVGHIKAFKKIAMKALKDHMPKLFGILPERIYNSHYGNGVLAMFIS